MNKPILIWGNDGIAVHVINDLATAGRSMVVFVEDKRDRVARAAKKAGATVIVGSPTHPDDLDKAGDLNRFGAFALLLCSDSHVLSAGLLLSKVAPSVPLLMRMFVTEVATSISHLTDATVMSASQIAAPVILDLAIDPTDETMNSWQARKALSGSYIPRLSIVGRRTVAAAMLLSTLLMANTLVDRHVLHMTWVDAMVATAQMCFGDLAVENAPDIVKLLSVFTLAVGGLSVLLFFSAAHHSIALRMSAHREKTIPGRNHVIIFGGGKTGMRVVQRLHALEIPVVVVDSNPQCHAASFCAVNDIPFRLGSAIDGELMKHLNIKSARSVLAITNNDAVNIESALRARSIRADVRVVVRAFDPDVAERLDTDVNIHRAVSVSATAGPMFASKLVDMTTPVPAGASA